MNDQSRTADNVSAVDPELDRLLEVLASKLAAGESVDLDSLAGGNPQRRKQLEQMLPTVRMLASLAGGSTTAR